jgi:hypothetical protein
VLHQQLERPIPPVPVSGSHVMQVVKLFRASILHSNGEQNERDPEGKAAVQLI